MISGMKRKRDANDYFAQGNKHIKSNNWHDAQFCFDEYLKLELNCAEGWEKLGLCSENLGFPDKAYREYTKAIEIDNNNWSAFHNRGRLLLDVNHFQQAHQDLSQAKLLSTNNPFVLASFAEYYLRREDYSQSIEEYKQALLATPDNDEIFRKIVQSNLATAYCHYGNNLYINHQYEEAITSYKLSLDLAPSTELALNQIGMANFHLERYQEAKGYFNELIRFYQSQNIENNDGWMNVAECYYKLNFLKLARESLYIAKKISPSDEDILKLERNIAAKQILWFFRNRMNKKSGDSALLKASNKEIISPSPDKFENSDTDKEKPRQTM